MPGDHQYIFSDAGDGARARFADSESQQCGNDVRNRCIPSPVQPGPRIGRIYSAPREHTRSGPQGRTIRRFPCAVQFRRSESSRADAARRALSAASPETLINDVLIPALDAVGNDFETGRIFLPQLLQSAAAAQSAFEIVKSALAISGTSGPTRGKDCCRDRQRGYSRHREKHRESDSGELRLSRD